MWLLVKVGLSSLSSGFTCASDPSSSSIIRGLRSAVASAGSASLLAVGMDVCALPNNNHPEKFLQLDVGMLPLTQVGALMLGQRHWQNRVYVQVGRRSAVGSLACLRFPGQVKRTGGRCELSGTPPCGCPGPGCGPPAPPAQPAPPVSHSRVIVFTQNGRETMGRLRQS